MKKKKDLLTIEKIVRKVNPAIVNFVKKSHKVDLNHFLQKYKTHGLSESEQFSIGISLLYLAYKNNKEFDGIPYISFIFGKWDSFRNVMLSNSDYRKESGSLDNSPDVLKSIEDGYELFNIRKGEKINSSLEDFISNYIEDSIYERIGVESRLDLSVTQHIPIELYESIRSSLFKSGTIGTIGSLSRYLASLGLESGELFFDTKIDNYVLENIFRDYSYAIKYDGASESEKSLYIIACLFIYNLVELYKECKDMYLNNLIEEKYKEALELENEIKIRKDEYKTELSKHKKEIKESRNEIELLKKRIKELEKENSKLVSKNIKDTEKINDLEKEISEYNMTIEELKEECSSLSETALTVDNSISIEDKIEYINQYKIGIFGGMSNIKTLSSKLNNISFYTSQNQDISSISNLDAIFVSYEFFNHAFTKKLNSVIKKYDIPRSYISGTNNDLVINNIYWELIKIKK